jgi:ABC-type sulfate transport system permease component
MRVISYVFSLLCLYLVFKGWSFLWNVHFLLPIGIVLAMVVIGMAFIVTAEDRKKARIDRMFEEMCDRYDEEKCQRRKYDE